MRSSNGSAPRPSNEPSKEALARVDALEARKVQATEIALRQWRLLDELEVALHGAIGTRSLRATEELLVRGRHASAVLALVAAEQVGDDRSIAQLEVRCRDLTREMALAEKLWS